MDDRRRSSRVNRRVLPVVRSQHAPRSWVDLFRLERKKKVGKLSKGQHTASRSFLPFRSARGFSFSTNRRSGLDPVFQRVVVGT